MGPNDGPKGSSTSHKPDAAPDPAESMLLKESSHTDDDPPSRISPKTEVTASLPVDSAAQSRELSQEKENSPEPESDPFLDTPCKGTSRLPLFHSSGANPRWIASSQQPPFETLHSSTEDNGPTKESYHRYPSQRRTSLSSSPGLKPNTNHARAISAPPPVSETIGKAIVDPPIGNLSDSVSKALETLGRPSRLDANHTVETTKSQTPQGPGLWLFRKYNARKEGITAGQKQDILANVLPSNSESSPIQPAGVEESPAIDSFKVRSAPRTPSAQNTHSSNTIDRSPEHAVKTAELPSTPVDTEILHQPESVRPKLSTRKRRPDLHDQCFSAAKRIWSMSPRPIPTPIIKIEAAPGKPMPNNPHAFTPHQTSESWTPHLSESHPSTFVGASGKAREQGNKDQMQYLEFFEADAMLDRLLELRYFQGARTSLDRLSLMLRLLQGRELRTSEKETRADPKDSPHVKSHASAAAANTGKIDSVKDSKIASTKPDARLYSPIGAGASVRSSVPVKPMSSSKPLILSSATFRSKCDTALRDSHIFYDLPDFPTLDGALSAWTDIDRFEGKGKEKGKEAQELIQFISPEGNIILRKFRLFYAASIQQHLVKEIQEPLTPEEYKLKSTGRLYIYWVQGNFGLVKIGWTRGTVEERLLGKSGWLKKCGHIPRPIHLDAECSGTLPHARRIEKLIHAEFRDQRLQQSKCAGCGIEHKEWFAVSNELAKNVAQKWCRWMKDEDPYEYTGPRTVKGRGKNKDDREEEIWTLREEQVIRLKENRGPTAERTYSEGDQGPRRSSVNGPGAGTASKQWSDKRTASHLQNNTRSLPTTPTRKYRRSSNIETRSGTASKLLSPGTQTDNESAQDGPRSSSATDLSNVTPTEKARRFSESGTGISTASESLSPEARLDRESASKTLDSPSREDLPDTQSVEEHRPSSDIEASELPSPDTPTPPGRYNLRPRGPPKNADAGAH